MDQVGQRGLEIPQAGGVVALVHQGAHGLFDVEQHLRQAWGHGCDRGPGADAGRELRSGSVKGRRHQRCPHVVGITTVRSRSNAAQDSAIECDFILPGYGNPRIVAGDQHAVSSYDADTRVGDEQGEQL